MHGPAHMESLRCLGCSCLSLRMEARSSPLAHSWGHFGDQSSPRQCGDRGTEQAKAPCSPSPSLVSLRARTPLFPYGNPQLTGLTEGRGFISKHDLTWNGTKSVWLGCPSCGQPLAHPHSLLNGGHTERNRASLGLSRHRSAPEKCWCIFSTG